MTVLPTTLQNFLENYASRYLPSGVEVLRLLVGVSGGPDSVALLHGLHTLQNSSSLTFPLEIQVAHLNHLIRGESAVQDAQYVAQLCQ